MKKIFLKYTEGCCWRRVLDLELIQHFFIKNNCKIVNHPADADIICLMTCAFVKRTENIAISEIKNILDCQYRGKLIVVGCLPGINMSRLRESFNGIAINTIDIENLNNYFPEFSYQLKLAQDVNALFCQKKTQAIKITIVSILKYLYDNFNLSLTYFSNLFRNFKIILKSGMGLKRKVHYVRIGWGCEEPHCSFCVEWYAVGGKFISKPLDNCLDEVKKGFQKGYKNFVLIADNPGAWGSDIGKKFPELIKSILEIDPAINIANIDGLHPYWLLQYQIEFVELVKTKRIKSVMSALQSGCNRILGLMERLYTKEQFLQLMKSIKQANPNIVLMTQIIAGFPSETLEEFKESVFLVKDIGFTNVTVFPFYSNPITPAFQLAGSISEEDKAERVDYALKTFGKEGIFSFSLGAEINPKYQKKGMQNNFIAAEATEYVSCPVCNSKKNSILFAAEDYEYQLPGRFFVSKCFDCGLIYQNPRPVFQDICRYYTDKYEPFRKVGSSLMQKIRYKLLTAPKIAKYQNLFSSLDRKINLLDVGCAHGDLLAQLSINSDFICKGVEPVEYAADIARKRGFDVACTTLEKYEAANESFDLITMNHVLEHLPNPEEAVEKVYQLLRKNGYFCGEIPCSSCLERLIFRKYWRMYHLPRHLTFFSKKSIVVFLEKIGFKEVDVHIQPVPGIWQGSLRNYLLKKHYPDFIVKIFSPHSVVLSSINFPFTFLLAKLGYGSIAHFTAKK